MSLFVNFKKIYFPVDWDDDIRMNFLFSVFRERYINPEGYDGKLNFWSNTIQHLCSKCHVLVISLESLKSALQRNGRQPLCLDIVFDEMIKQGILVNAYDFKKVEQEKGWLGWGIDTLVRKPVVLGFSSVKSLLNWAKKDQEFIVLPVVKDLANQLWDRYQELVESKWTESAVFLEHFQKECKGICSESLFQLAVIQLQRERRACIFIQNGEKVIKFWKQEDKKVHPLSELDKGILSLNRARETIIVDIETLEENITNCNEVAKKFITIGAKEKATTTLKKRKRLQIAVQKKCIALDNIEHLLCQLKNSGSEKMVLEAYKSGVKAMKGTFTDDLGLDNIDDVMADVKEVLDDYSEIQNSIGLPMDDSNIDELEQELSDLLQDNPEVHEPVQKPRQTSDEDLLKRLAALRAPPEDAPPAKKPFIRTAARAF